MADARRLFASELLGVGATLQLPMESAQHAQVLRLRVGERVSLFDAAGGEADAEIACADRGALSCRVLALRTVPPPERRLTLVLGVPKAPKLEILVRMITELGVHALALAHTERSVPKLGADSPKLERLRRVAREACAQSGQSWAPEIAAPEALLEVAARAPTDALRVVFWEHASVALARVLSAAPLSAAREVWAVVGPEGGLAAQEVDALCGLGYPQAGLGAGILRVDTAAVVVSALLLDRMRMLGA